MTLPPYDRQHLKEVFAGARALPASERQAYVSVACAGNEALRQEVESLLASDERAASFLESPAVVWGDGTPQPAQPMIEGRRLGAYQVQALLGAGGMGEVYRARDTELNRDVALKLLPDAFASDPERFARMTREAQTLASLNHPHIAAIYGIEKSDGIRALVMELVEGEDLSQRIARGPIPLAEALPMARQIAEALEAAHEQGIVHRDLKPANIKVRADGAVKVLDFGLAKATEVRSASAAAAALADSPIRYPAASTDTLMIAGTPAYMSPEQAAGKGVTRRSDLWAFGVVLFEMLTGRRAFTGETSSHVLAAVLDREPDWARLPPGTPPVIRTLLRRCLEKDSRRRLDSAADARLEIEEAMAAPREQSDAIARRSRPAAAWLTAAVVGGALISGVVVWRTMEGGRRAPAPPVTRFAIVPLPDQPLNLSGSDRDVTVSPNGRHLVYRTGGIPSFGSPLTVRAIDQLDARQIPDLGARGVFSSADSRWIGFFTNTELRKVSIDGGPAITLYQVSGAPLGASWGEDNTIVFATDDPSTGLWRMSADGGKPMELTTPDAAKHESDHAFPSILPGGRGVLFTITAAGHTENAQVAALDLTTGERKTLVRGGSQAEYVDPSAGSGQAGYLIYAAADTLRAVRFDLARLEVLGDPVTVLEHVMMKPTGAANYAVSRQGTLLYVPAGVSTQTPSRSLVWVDRKGHEEPIKAPPGDYCCIRVSPDGTRLVLETVGQENADIWIWDLGREQLKRLTFTAAADGLPLWTPDSQRVIFNSDRALSGVRNLYSQPADGSGTVDRLTTSANGQYPSSITPDGKFVVGVEHVPSATSTSAAPDDAERRTVTLYSLASPASRPEHTLSPGASAEPSRQALFSGGWPEVSPDGRYIAYESSEFGRREIFVRPFSPVDSGRWQISTAGGTRPVWARDGRELFFIDASNTLTAVPVDTSGSTFSPGKPAKVFDAKYAQPYPPRHYDVSPDGRRFVMLKNNGVSDPKAPSASMVVVEHFFEELKRLVPTR